MTQNIFKMSENQQIRNILEGHSYGVNSVSYSPILPDGSTRIVSGSWDNMLRLWDAETGKPVLRNGEPLVFRCLSWSYITCVRYSPNGKRIVSGSYDGTLRLWVAAPVPAFQRRSPMVHLLGHLSAIQNAEDYGEKLLKRRRM